MIQEKIVPDIEESFYIINVRRYGDDRGVLTTIEEDTDIPFNIKRVYYISDVSKEKERAHHAHFESQRVLSAIQGSVNVMLFDGKRRETFILDNPAKAIYFNKLVWCELSNFENNAIVLALASQQYNETDYIRNYDDYIKIISSRGQ